ncbi:protein NOI4-like isoform X1 [Salvia splendens]|uniref:protein NOI4-like isoform X1 n=1 Tax=Salvia splendens TaxID=180675 RepID=UPI001C268013|nr:protein NOI4-like isoform X1 [Salvia splendens]
MVLTPFPPLFSSAKLFIFVVHRLACFWEKGRPLPKFGDWDVNDPTSAEGFTVIFNKARDEKKTGGKPDSPSKVDTNTNYGGAEPIKPQGKKWFCCMQSPSAES